MNKLKGEILLMSVGIISLISIKSLAEESIVYPVVPWTQAAVRAFLNDGNSIYGSIFCVDTETLIIDIPKLKSYVEEFKTERKKLFRNEIKYIEGKSPGLAFIIALGPGFFVHGLGHWYANDGFIAGGLATAEVMSAFSYYNPNLSNSLFFGSWLIDIIDAPFAAMRYNSRLKRYGFPVKE